VGQLVGRYIAERRVEGLEERTLAQMRGRLRDFASSAPAEPAKVTRRTVVAWLDRPGLTASYQRTRLSTLRGFCRWCVVHRHMRRDPTADLALPRVAESIPRRLTTEEARRLVDACRHDRRLLLVVLLELQLGLRRLEVSRLNVEDIDWTERTLTIRGKGHQGRASAVLPVDDETWSALGRYLGEAGHRNGPLVRNRVRAHGRMAASTIGELVGRAMVDAGVKRPGDSTRTPHSLRHTMGSEVLERTGSLRLAQQALRHASVHSTEVYVRGVVGGDLREAMAGRRYG
jgi:integrase/recombinase XerC